MLNRRWSCRVSGKTSVLSDSVNTAFQVSGGAAQQLIGGREEGRQQQRGVVTGVLGRRAAAIVHESARSASSVLVSEGPERQGGRAMNEGAIRDQGLPVPAHVWTRCDCSCSVNELCQDAGSGVTVQQRARRLSMYHESSLRGVRSEHFKLGNAAPFSTCRAETAS